MLTEELSDKLTETVAICDLHYQRMMFAWEKVKMKFPLTENILSNLTPIELALFDQLIYRFSKLQDSMGTRLFKQLLEALEEDIYGLPFIDILYKLEKIKLIDNARDWIALRQTRNTLSHEYPFYKESQTEELNLLPDDVLKLINIWSKLRDYTVNRITNN
jgi:hypothetical protein